ncbi:hypothetical protein [Pedobacter mendelii]|uniref:Uncharacterized protein n=1 Tax=Pedobacter mendelii TaxID=1908240 RepID=A0ABQ2BM37_9SPHI|nr:hypothetical protein [Pedobacter mendelii]GGI29197.1 hypothetical protein GCM10008119_36430 [Pedobacter mendelii]
MKNQDYNLTAEYDVTNIDQFQIDRSEHNEKLEFDIENSADIEPDPIDKEDDDDSEYSDDEVEFADGEGTLLNEEFDEEDNTDE